MPKSKKKPVPNEQDLPLLGLDFWTEAAAGRAGYVAGFDRQDLVKSWEVEKAAKWAVALQEKERDRV